MDFIQAYPQAPAKSTIFLRTPPGVELAAHNKQETVLKFKRNLYGLKGSERTWFQHLGDGLTRMNFVPTESDPCVFMREDDTMILYVDDCIIILNDEAGANYIHRELATHRFKTTDEESMESYLGLQFTHNNDGSFRVVQRLLTERIIQTIPGMQDARGAKLPAAVGEPLTKDEDGAERLEQ